MLWKNYFFTVDFSGRSDLLATLTAGTVVDEAIGLDLAAAFRDLDPHGSKQELWNVHPQHDHSVLGATVVYNGPNDDMLPTNARYTHVLTLDFRDTEDGKAGGRVYLHYNLGV